MRQTLLLAGALLLVITSASAIAPRKRYSRRMTGAGLTRSLLMHSTRYLAEVKAGWRNQPVPVDGGYKRYSPFTVLSTSARVDRSDSAVTPYVGYLFVKVRYRETARFSDRRRALVAPYRGEKEYTFEPAFGFRQGKWVPISEE